MSGLMKCSGRCKDGKLCNNEGYPANRADGYHCTHHKGLTEPHLELTIKVTGKGADDLDYALGLISASVLRGRTEGVLNPGTPEGYTWQIKEKP